MVSSKNSARRVVSEKSKVKTKILPKKNGGASRKRNAVSRKHTCTTGTSTKKPARPADSTLTAAASSSTTPARMPNSKSVSPSPEKMAPPPAKKRFRKDPLSDFRMQSPTANLHSQDTSTARMVVPPPAYPKYKNVRKWQEDHSNKEVDPSAYFLPPKPTFKNKKKEPRDGTTETTAPDAPWFRICTKIVKRHEGRCSCNLCKIVADVTHTSDPTTLSFSPPTGSSMKQPGLAILSDDSIESGGDDCESDSHPIRLPSFALPEQGESSEGTFLSGTPTDAIVGQEQDDPFVLGDNLSCPPPDDVHSIGGSQWMEEDSREFPSILDSSTAEFLPLPDLMPSNQVQKKSAVFEDIDVLFIPTC